MKSWKKNIEEEEKKIGKKVRCLWLEDIYIRRKKKKTVTIGSSEEQTVKLFSEWEVSCLASIFKIPTHASRE